MVAGVHVDDFSLVLRGAGIGDARRKVFGGRPGVSHSQQNEDQQKQQVSLRRF